MQYALRVKQENRAEDSTAAFNPDECKKFSSFSCAPPESVGNMYQFRSQYLESFATFSLSFFLHLVSGPMPLTTPALDHYSSNKP